VTPAQCVGTYITHTQGPAVGPTLLDRLCHASASWLPVCSGKNLQRNIHR